MKYVVLYHSDSDMNNNFPKEIKSLIQLSCFKFLRQHEVKVRLF